MAESYIYEPFHWLNEIIEQDEHGNVVYEKDEGGNTVYIKDRLGNYVLDPITRQPIPQPKILQEGTRHEAKRENHQEEGIAKAHELLVKLENRMVRVETQLEIDGWVDPINKGTFFDNFVDAPNKLKRLLASAVLTEPYSVGMSLLNVDDASGFKVGEEVTIFDGTNSEDTMITAVTASTITVNPLVKSYLKGATVTRSNAGIENGHVVGGNWESFGVSASEVV